MIETKRIGTEAVIDIESGRREKRRTLLVVAHTDVESRRSIRRRREAEKEETQELAAGNLKQWCLPFRQP